MSVSLRALALTSTYLFFAASAGSILAWLLHGVLDYSYYKVLTRSILLFAAIGLIPMWRVAGLSASGIGLKPVQWRALLQIYPLGILMVLPAMLFFMVVQFRVVDDRVDYAGLEIWSFVVVAVLSGVLVAVFEETLFRGVLFGVLRRAGSYALTASAVSVLYASVHFLTSDSGLVDTVAWYTGYGFVLESFAGLADPSGYWDAFVALFLLGLLLCWVRENYGLWWCIGLHAAWVFAIRLFKELTVRDIYSPYASWVSSYDNFVGNLVSVWLIFMFVVLALSRLVKAR